MGYYLHLARQYMWHNKARTLYSVLGIALTYILSFCILTVGYSAWDYQYCSIYASDPYELYSTNADAAAEAQVAALRKLVDDPAVEDIRIDMWDPEYAGSWRRVLPGQLKAGEQYWVKIKLKNTGNLRKSAAELGEKYGIGFDVYRYVEQYLRQDDSVETAFLNLIITVTATVFALFSVVILRNTMMIAVTERSRDYGLLRCVGMSEKQNFCLLLSEGVIMSLMASALGLGIGFEMLKLSEPWLINMLELNDVFAFHFYPKAAGYTTLLCMGVTLFSLIEPARLSSQVSPLEALHGALAKELTVGKALKILASKIIGNKKREKKKTPLAEKLFGVSGFYANRNRLRSRGGRKAVFIAVFISVALLLTVMSFAGSVRATMRKIVGGTVDEYRELLYEDRTSDGVNCYTYDDEWVRHITDTLEGKSGITDMFSAMTSMFGYGDMSPYFYDEELKRLNDRGHGSLCSIYEMGCKSDDMEKERPYLIEGEIDYEKMIEENGVLLCDISPLLKDEGRKTSYHAGDTIELLSLEGAQKARRIYLDAIIPVSERLGMAAWYDYGKRKVIYYENGVQKEEKLKTSRDEGENKPALFNLGKNGSDDEEFYVIRDEVLKELEQMGYDCRDRLQDTSYRMTDILECLREIAFEEGYREEIKVMGVISQEVFSGESLDKWVFDRSGKPSYIRIVYPAESLCERVEKIAAAEGVSSNGNKYNFLSETGAGLFRVTYSFVTGIRRDMDILDYSIRDFAEKNGIVYENQGGYDYFQLSNMLNVLTVICLIVCGFILLVCLFQVLNTLQADMRIRRKELWLYDVVGMEPRQKLKMMLLEHGFGVAIAVCLGAAVSFIGSYIFIQRFLIIQMGNDYVYVWPVGPALLITALVFGTVIGVNLLQWKRAEGYIRDRR